MFDWIYCDAYQYFERFNLIELLGIELLDHLIVSKRMTDVYWTVSDTQQYWELFNFLKSCEIELFEIELFDHLTVCIYNMCSQII